MSSGSFRRPSSPSGSLPPGGISSGSFRTADLVAERYRVLVVDDEPAVLLSLQSVLSEDGDLMTCEMEHLFPLRSLILQWLRWFRVGTTIPWLATFH